MPGLIEWRLGDSYGLQVWSEPDRAGRSSVVLEDTDLDEAAACQDTNNSNWHRHAMATSLHVDVFDAT